VVRQPSRPATIVADHPIAQRLPVHACDARGGLPAQPIQRGGDRQQAPGDPRVALDLGQPTQFDRGDVLADQKGGHGRPLDAMHADESRPPASAQAKESAFQPVGISRAGAAVKNLAHSASLHAGEHAAIIDEALWDAVQSQLTENRADRASGSNADQPSRRAGWA